MTRREFEDDDSFWDQIIVTVPTAFKPAAVQAARQHYMMVPEYCRAVLLSALEADGVELEAA